MMKRVAAGNGSPGGRRAGEAYAGTKWGGVTEQGAY